MEGFPDGKLDFIGNALQYEKNGVPKGTEELSRRVGFTGNVNYIYNNRYFMDLSFRVDGSSLFGTKNKFAPFWSAGIGWNVHNEKFMQNQNIVNNLRIEDRTEKPDLNSLLPIRRCQPSRVTRENVTLFGTGLS